jgi:serine-type D-Ala-D-Ala carboxypeptidase/endopeptidase (penicillin-binding protein 4)
MIKKLFLLSKSILSVFLLITACTTSKPRINERKFRQMIEDSPVFSQNFTGFALYDTENNEMVYNYQADKYYTPASNTKIFTLYAGLQLLGDHIPALEYASQGDSMIFTGTGDPAFLHPDIATIDTTYQDKVYDFLKNRTESLFYAQRPWKDEYFGPGWAWSDYSYYYSAEKSVFPMYGNVVRFQFKENLSKPLAYPPYFTSFIEAFPNEEAPYYVFRNQAENRFVYRSKADSLAFSVDIPFKISVPLLTNLLSDTLKRSIRIYKGPLPKDRLTLYSIPADSLYKRMMQISDNFIAEQLLLVCSSVQNDTLSSDWTIDYVKKNYLHDLPDEPVWVDGSGLSRYNLQTPRSMVALLHKVNALLSDEQIKNIFPAGGVSGTIQNWYGGQPAPYVFAKTGTLSNKHCLSGFLYTHKGKKLIFSFMHNNYVISSSVLKTEMQKILQTLYLEY